MSVEEQVNEIGRRIYKDEWPTVLAHNLGRLRGEVDEQTFDQAVAYRALLGGLRRFEQWQRERQVR